MKKNLLFIVCWPLLAYGMEEKPFPKGKDLAMQVCAKAKLMPAAHTIPATTSSDEIKFAELKIVVWRNEQYDHERWHRMIELLKEFENAPFSSKELVSTILDEIKLTENKKGNSLWGNTAVAFITDSQKIDGKNVN